MLEDTIAAIATPPGAGGIAIIRVSGPFAEAIFHGLFRPSKSRASIQSHHLYHGDIVSPETGVVLDEVMATLMRGPHSYTGEDVLEIHGHGGFLLPQQILAAAIRSGARPAQAGEFTRRAFLNGRLDLTQAEAVADLIAARTEKGREVALSHLHGSLAREVEHLIGDITDILVHTEAAIDFSEDTDGTRPDEDLAGQLRSLARELECLAATYDRGRMYRNGVSLVLAGRVNVGKSSLLNRLLGERRAIVAPTPGTTRDFIEEAIDLRGVAVRLTDTAGIRTTDNPIEQAGIDLVWEKIDDADAVIILLDGSSPLSGEDEDLFRRCSARPIIPVVNKMDLPRGLVEADLLALTGGRPPIWISAKYDTGLDGLKEALHRHFTAEPDEGTLPTAVITNLRHRLALERAASSLAQAAERALGGKHPELTAADIRDALESLEEIGGKVTDDAILDRIFSQFCIGK